MKLQYETELYHHGIPGMHWYKRRFQNEDGSYTALGKLRYGIGQKGRETAKMMSEWSRQMTSKEASNASKMHATSSGTKYFDNPHMLYNGNVRKTARSLMDEYAQASRKNGQPIARASEPSQQYAKDRMRAMARSIGGNDEARAVAARSQYPGEKMRNWDDRLSQYMWNYTTKNPEQGAKAREKAFTPVMSRSDNTKLYLQGAKNLAGNYARYAKEGLTGAAATALVAKNGIQARAGDAVGALGKDIKGTAGAWRDLAAAYGKDIQGNMQSGIQRGVFNYLNAAKQRGTGDPGEDRAKTERILNGYDTQKLNAKNTILGLKRADAEREAAARQQRDDAVRSSVRNDIAKYQKEMMDDYYREGKMSRGDSVKASQYMERSGYGGDTPFVLEFGKEKVTSNPVKALREFNNPSTPNLRSGAQGSKDDRMLAYQEAVNSILGRSGQSSAFQRMKNLESQMNAYRDNQARAKAASSDDPRIKALLSNNKQVQGEHTNYFGRNLRQLNEAHNRENWDWDQGEKRANTWQRDYNKAEQFAKEHTPKHLREIGHIDQNLLRAKMSEIQSERDDYERKNTQIPDWVKRDYGTSRADIPQYIWEELKKRR